MKYAAWHCVDDYLAGRLPIGVFDDGITANEAAGPVGVVDLWHEKPRTWCVCVSFNATDESAAKEFAERIAVAFTANVSAPKEVERCG